MENFIPILLVLIVIGAASYNSVLEARRKAAKGHRKQAHDEAWPSWDTASAPQPESEHEPVDETTETSSWRPEIDMPDNVKEPVAEEVPTTPRKADLEHKQTVKVTPATTSNTARTTTSAADRLSSAVNTTFTEQKPQVQQPETQDEVQATDVAEDFDLRRAVIYSEILKPKFNE